MAVRFRGPSALLAAGGARTQWLYYCLAPELYEGRDPDFVSVGVELWRVLDRERWSEDPLSPGAGALMRQVSGGVPDGFIPLKWGEDFPAGWYGFRVSCGDEAGWALFWAGSKVAPVEPVERPTRARVERPDEASVRAVA